MTKSKKRPVTFPPNDDLIDELKSEYAFENARILIIGQYGIGKTRTIDYLMKKTSDQYSSINLHGSISVDGALINSLTVLQRIFGLAILSLGVVGAAIISMRPNLIPIEVSISVSAILTLIGLTIEHPRRIFYNLTVRFPRKKQTYWIQDLDRCEFTEGQIYDFLNSLKFNSGEKWLIEYGNWAQNTKFWRDIAQKADYALIFHPSQARICFEQMVERVEHLPFEGPEGWMAVFTPRAMQEISTKIKSSIESKWHSPKTRKLMALKEYARALIDSLNLDSKDRQMLGFANTFKFKFKTRSMNDLDTTLVLDSFGETISSKTLSEILEPVKPNSPDNWAEVFYSELVNCPNKKNKNKYVQPVVEYWESSAGSSTTPDATISPDQN